MLEGTVDGSNQDPAPRDNATESNSREASETAITVEPPDDLLATNGLDDTDDLIEELAGSKDEDRDPDAATKSQSDVPFLRDMIEEKDILISKLESEKKEMATRNLLLIQYESAVPKFEKSTRELETKERDIIAENAAERSILEKELGAAREAETKAKEETTKVKDSETGLVAMNKELHSRIAAHEVTEQKYKRRERKEHKKQEKTSAAHHQTGGKESRQNSVSGKRTSVDREREMNLQSTNTYAAAPPPFDPFAGSVPVKSLEEVRRLLAQNEEKEEAATSSVREAQRLFDSKVQLEKDIQAQQAKLTKLQNEHLQTKDKTRNMEANILQQKAEVAKILDEIKKAGPAVEDMTIREIIDHIDWKHSNDMDCGAKAQILDVRNLALIVKKQQERAKEMLHDLDVAKQNVEVQSEVIKERDEAVEKAASLEKKVEEMEAKRRILQDQMATTRVGVDRASNLARGEEDLWGDN